MSYIGGGMYHAEPCPECGNTLWNGRCENRTVSITGSPARMMTARNPRMKRTIERSNEMEKTI